MVFAPKYRRQIIYGKYKRKVRVKSSYYYVKEKCIEIHARSRSLLLQIIFFYMLVSIPLKLSISSLIRDI
ncbi:MAG: hypothetical protein ACLU4Q_01325 [Streptococcus thermophilus]